MKQSARLLSVGEIAPERGPFRDEYLLKNGKEYLARAQAAVAAVAEVLQGFKLPVVQVTGNDEVDLDHLGQVVHRWEDIRERFADVVEERLREPIEAAVDNAVDALNFLEDTELCETAHDLVHQAAWLRFGFLNCKLQVDDGEVQSDCPVRLAHERWGFSPELKTNWACSICHKRFDTCLHIPNREYEIVVDHAGNKCSACSKEKCDHKDGESAIVLAQMVSTGMELIAVAKVARPRDPRARMVSSSLDVPPGSEIFKECENGTAVCTACILPCTGFIEPDDLK